MNSMSIYNLRRKKTLSLLMSFLPKNKLLQIIKTSRRLQKALRIKPILYEIYSLKQSNIYKEYDLTKINEDDYTKREILSSLFEISNTPFFNGIGYTIQSHDKRISSMNKLSDGQIATISWDNTVKIWDLENNKMICSQVLSINKEDIICSIIQLDKKRLLVSTWDKDIIIFNMQTKEKEEEFSIEHFGKLMCTIIMGDLFIVSSYDPRIKIWKFNERKHIKTLIGHNGAVPIIIPLNDGRLASGSWDTTVKIWNLITGECAITIATKNDKIISLLQLNDGRLASCSLDSFIKIWAINTHTAHNDCTFEGNDFLYQLKDGRIVTGLLPKEYQIVNPSNGTKEIVVRTDHREQISSIIQLNDGRIVTCSFDKSLKLYGFVNKKELSKEALEYDFIFSNRCLYISNKFYSN